MRECSGAGFTFLLIAELTEKQGVALLGGDGLGNGLGNELGNGKTVKVLLAVGAAAPLDLLLSAVGFSRVLLMTSLFDSVFLLVVLEFQERSAEFWTVTNLKRGQRSAIQAGGKQDEGKRRTESTDDEEEEAWRPADVKRVAMATARSTRGILRLEFVFLTPSAPRHALNPAAALQWFLVQRPHRPGGEQNRVDRTIRRINSHVALHHQERSPERCLQVGDALSSSRAEETQYLSHLWPLQSSTSQKSCPGAALLDSRRSIFAAVDSLVGELSCKRKENGSQSEDSFMEVEQNIRWIVDSSIKVFSDLGTNLSGFDVLEQIGILDSLSVDDYNDPAFIRLWFSLKMTFLLPFVTDSFLFQLGNKNFSCSSFQELVKSFSEGLETSKTTERQQIYSNFIRVYLTRKDTAEPGCTENVAGNGEWLEKNIQSFLVLATLQDLKTMNRNFSGSDVLEKLSPQQRAELILDPNNRDNADLVRVIIKNMTMSGNEEQLKQFFQKFSILSKE
ncbi:hypothetical protein CCH79_00020250, partial [Gambusia affinis]